MIQKTKVLKGKKAIMEYLNISEFLLIKYIKKGMPVVIDGNRYLAHADTLEDFFKEYTLCQGK